MKPTKPTKPVKTAEATNIQHKPLSEMTDAELDQYFADLQRSGISTFADGIGREIPSLLSSERK